MNTISLPYLIAALFAAKHSKSVTNAQAITIMSIAYTLVDVSEGRLALPDPSDINPLAEAIAAACKRNR